MRAVVDTNVLVRAVIKPEGPMGSFITRLWRGDFTLLYSEELLAELVDVLNRPYIRDKRRLADEDIWAVRRVFRRRGQAIVPSVLVAVCRDPKDDKFLEVAKSGGANAIVSADEDLLVLSPFEGIPIVTPAAFLAMLDAEGQKSRMRGPE